MHVAHRSHPFPRLAGWLTTLALAVACGRQPPPPPPPPAVTVAAVLEREVTEWDDFTGRLEPVEAVDVRPRVSGYIQQVAFTEGSEVRRGDVLFVIDPRPYAAELDRAQAELERARTRAALAASEVERAQRLLAVQAISREEFDSKLSARTEGQAAVRAAEATLANDRLSLEWTRVRAPIAGRVSRAAVTQGNLVQAGPPTATLLTTVVSLDPIYVYFDGDEQSFLKYAGLARSGARRNSSDARTPVELGLANEDGFPHRGYVDFVDNRLDSETGTIRLRAVFSNRDRTFTPGLFARLRLQGSGRYRAALIQDKAVGTDQDRKFVLVLKPDRTVEYRPIRLGPLIGALRVVREGLAPGERILVNGLQRVRPGMRVAAQEAAMADSATSLAVRAGTRAQ